MPKISKLKTVLLVANGDLRNSANEVCWPAQRAMEQRLTAAVAQLGYRLVRAHPYKPAQKHGFISSQKVRTRLVAFGFVNGFACVNGSLHWRCECRD